MQESILTPDQYKDLSKKIIHAVDTRYRIISNNSLLYLETQNTVASRLLGMILNNFIVNPFRIMSLGSKDHFFEKFLAYELRFCW